MKHSPPLLFSLLLLACATGIRADELIVPFESPPFALDTRLPSSEPPGNSLIVQAESPSFTLDTSLPDGTSSTNAVVIAESPSFTLDTRVAVPLPSGCVAWWSGEGNVMDCVGGNHGAVLHRAIEYAPGRVGQGFRFAGPDAGIRIPASPSLNVGSGDGFTVELWLNPDDLSVGVYAPIFEWYRDDVNSVFLGHGGDGAGSHPGILFGGLNGSGAYFGTPAVLVPGVFQHVAFVYDRGTGLTTIYHNGIAVASRSVGNVSLAHTTADLHLGIDERNSVHRWSFAGVMDELAIYNRALSAAEIAAIYDAGSAGKVRVLKIVTDLQPAIQTRGVTDQASFSLLVSGSGPLTYQWRHDGTPFTNTATGTLTLTNLQLSDAGSYDVVVSDLTSLTITSQVATLTVKLCEPPAPGLVAWWSGDGHFGDLAGTNHGFGVNGAGFAPGKVGQAFSLDGVDDNVALPKVPLWDFGTNSFSINAWFKSDRPGNYGNIVRYDTGFAGSGCWAVGFMPDGRIHFGICSTDRLVYDAVTDRVYSDNNWHFVSAVRDATTGKLKVYIDGSPAAAEGPDGGTDVTGSAGANLLIGAGQWGGSYFTGLIDEVGIFNRALSANEIATLYAVGSAGQCKELKFIADLQPTSQTRGVMGQADFTAPVSGSGPLTYQWRHNGTPFTNTATGALTLTNLQFSNAGSYDVVVSDLTSLAITSQVATLTVKLCEPPAPGLAAWWSGDGHFGDLAGTNHGFGVNGAGFAPGKVGQAFSLDGVDDRVALPKVPLWDFGTNSFSINAWFKSDRLGDYGNIVCYDTGYLGSGFWMVRFVPDGRIEIVIGPANRSVYNAITDKVYSDNNWHFVSAVRDAAAGKLKVYIDGSPAAAEGTDGGADVTGSAGANLVIGAGAWGGAFFTGLIDEVEIFNRALSSDEIATLYAVGSAGQCKELKFFAGLQPASQTRGVTGQADFTAPVSGSGPLTYQWRHDGTPFATTAVGALTLTNLQLSDTGSYDVVVSDLTSLTITSQVATLNMVDRQPRSSCLAGWWPGEGNANDALGLYDGTLHGGVLFTNGIIGGAFSPNGGYVDLSVGPALDSFTLETWIWVDPAQNVGEQRVISHDNYLLGGTRKMMFLKSTCVSESGNGRPWLQVSGPSGSQGLAAPQPLSAGWHHLAGVRDTAAGRLELYVDGTLVAEAVLSVPDTIDSPVSTVLSGINPSVQIEPFHGLIDEPSIYICALSSNDIAGNYAAMLPVILAQPASTSVLPGSTVTFAVSVSGPAPVYQWRFNGVDILGATGNTLTLTTVQWGSAGNYDCVVTNLLGSVTSTVAVLTVPDIVPPDLTCPGNLALKTGSPTGAVVTFSVLASDNKDASPTVVCAPPSGSLFPIGTNAVQCAAWDASGNSNSCGFTVMLALNTVASQVVNLVVPDNSSLGRSSTIFLNSAIANISDVNVTLTLSNGWNGDLFAYVVHDSGYAVLLNRVGATYVNPLGYSDHGLNVTFDDQAANGDVHVYRYTLFGTDVTPLSGPLTNSWAPDGRATDPAYVLDTDPRTELLSSFNGLNAYGNWTLYVMDAEPGDESKLLSWGLDVTGTTAQPSFTLNPSNATVECSSNVTLTAAADGSRPMTWQWFFNETNAVPGGTSASLTLTNVHSLASGNYTLVASNLAGGSTSAVAVLTVVDSTPPVFTFCPPGGMLAAGPDCQVALPELAVLAVTTDACTSVTVTQSPPAGTMVGLGPHLVTLTAADASGNTNVCQATVTVMDTNPPVIICSTNITLVTTNPAGVAVGFTVTASDVCDQAPAIVSAPASGSVFPIGVTTVTNTATDAGGNAAICTFDVTVILNHNPVFPDYFMATVSNRTARLHRVKLLANTSDADGDPLTVSSVSPTSTNGAAVSWDGTYVSYVPVSRYVGADAFTVLITDGRGGSVTGNVFVSGTDGSAGGNRISLTATNGGWLLISAGVPGRIYQVQRSTNMVDWVVIATQAAPVHGVLDYLDATPPQGEAFYRMAAP